MKESEYKRSFPIKEILIIADCAVVLLSMCGAAVLRHSAVINTESWFNKRQYAFGLLPMREMLSSYEAEDILTSDVNESISDLEAESDYIAMVMADGDFYVYGQGVVNSCTIQKVFKGDDLSDDDRIEVYNLALWQNGYVSLLDGQTVMEKGEEYLLFLNKAPFTEIDHAYYPVSTYFGKYHLPGNTFTPSYLQMDENNAPPMLDEADRYDHIFDYDDTPEMVDTYRKTSELILQKYHVS